MLFFIALAIAIQIRLFLALGMFLFVLLLEVFPEIVVIVFCNDVRHKCTTGNGFFNMWLNL